MSDELLEAIDKVVKLAAAEGESWTSLRMAIYDQLVQETGDDPGEV